MDSVQLAAYCIAMLAEYLQEQWLSELRDIYQVPSSGMLQAGLSTVSIGSLSRLAVRGFQSCPSYAKTNMACKADDEMMVCVYPVWRLAIIAGTSSRTDVI